MTGIDHLDRLVIVNYSWAGGEPELRIRPVDSTSRLVPAVGFAVTYRVDPGRERHCPGRVPFRPGEGDYVDCLSRPQPGGRACVSCAVAAATLAGSLHHAHHRSADEIDAHIDAHLHQPNLLYLAGFRDGSVKVGTSTANRIDKRLLEQGAWTALVVAETVDGFVVRDLEDLITEQLGIHQSVGIGRKLSGIANPTEDEVVTDSLKAAARSVHRLMAEAALSGVGATEEPWSNPGHHLPQFDRVFAYPVDVAQDSHRFTVTAMIGRIAIVERAVGAATDEAKQDLFAIDIGRLFGVELELGDFQPIEVAVQDSLF
jgi:hypothetical protein